ncbi:MXAN_6230/SCO0854 family RING domain-containing protein [Micromonospora sp. NPDC085948]|uniref:MXAN_6230/SCO0854 family RING domain-containing protein n=1 Tax=Micromonospora sp. NPDC085948 TaxID=3155293 RepID=UPI0034184B72
MDAVATVVLRRIGAVPLPTAGSQTPADGPAWVTALEADLAARGWLLDAALRERFASLDPLTRMRWADWLSAVADEVVGADRDHVPLFRRFPDTPTAPEALYVERLIVHLLQTAAAPCILCGTVGSVQPLDPCGHLVCASCFAPEVYTACPICGRRLTADNTYLPLIPTPRTGPASRSGYATTAAPVCLRRLTLDVTPEVTALRLRDSLVARPAALGAADLADLRTLVAATAPGRLDWLPDVVPARETLAGVIAWALHATALTDTAGQVLADATARWRTATDVARTLWAYSGGDPGLVLPRPRETGGPLEAYRAVDEPRVTVEVPRVRALPRPLRRAVLAFLDSLDPATAAEDLARHPVVWKRLAERLHPFEWASAYPRAAVVFATLRATRVPAVSSLGRTLAAVSARRPERLILSSHADDTVSVRVRTFAALVEQAVAGDDAVAAAALLADRPGDLWRRIDHLLRLADDPAAEQFVLDAAARVAPTVAPMVLASAAAALHGRDTTIAVEAAEARAAVAADASVADVAATGSATGMGAVGAALRRALGMGGPARSAVVSPVPARGPEPGTPRRTFFPKGDVVRTWTAPERRRRLPADAVTRVRVTVDGELAERAGRHDRFDVAVLDAELAHVPAPMRERAGSEQLAGWSRGSVRALDGHEVVRLFLHWVDAGSSRVDLDLSCAFYDEAWTPVGHCDYTRLRFNATAAVHSGDLTSAPAPLGATEFLDLNQAALRAAGVVWAVPVVLSYNDVPFEALTAAFAGFSLPQEQGAAFDAARVMQRFGLRGDARSLAPLVLNVRTGQVMWVDASLSTRGYGHSVGQYGPRLGRVAADLWEHFEAGTRASVLDLVAWHAAARSDRILVTHADGTATEVPTGAPAATVAAIRAAAAEPGDLGVLTSFVGSRVLASMVDTVRLESTVGADVAGGSAALLIEGRAGTPWTALTVADLMAGLVPSLGAASPAVPGHG